MKRWKATLLCTLIALLLLPSAVLAHPGRTDAKGGHYNRKTGEYHYHHGYPAHQHPNGVCPYDFDDKTDHSSRSGSSYQKTPAPEPSPKKAEDVIRSTDEYEKEATAPIEENPDDVVLDFGDETPPKVNKNAPPAITEPAILIIVAPAVLAVWFVFFAIYTRKSDDEKRIEKSFVVLFLLQLIGAWVVSHVLLSWEGYDVWDVLHYLIQILLVQGVVFLFGAIVWAIISGIRGKKE